VLSVVLTVYNEAENLTELYDRISRVMSDLDQDYEIIFVDDGSVDKSPEILEGFCQKNPKVKTINLSRNFGQHAAVAAGFTHCQGDWVIWMDADLQDLPEEIPKLLREAEKGHDIVYGIRENRADPLLKRLTASIFFWLFRRISGHSLPKGLSTFRVLSRRVIEAFNELPERSRFTAGLIAWLGFSYSCVPIRHAPRTRGQSKYDHLKLFRLSLDALISFSDYPLKLSSKVGVFLAFLSLLMALYTMYRKLIYGFDITGYATLVTSLFFLCGLQLFFLGVVGEYISRIFLNAQGRPIYIVKKMTNF